MEGENREVFDTLSFVCAAEIEKPGSSPGFFKFPALAAPIGAESESLQVVAPPTRRDRHLPR